MGRRARRRERCRGSRAAARAAAAPAPAAAAAAPSATAPASAAAAATATAASRLGCWRLWRRRRGRRRVRLRSARGRVRSARRRTAACGAHDEPHARAGDRAHPADCVPHAGARAREHAACGHAWAALRHEPRVQRLQGALVQGVPHYPSRQVQAPARRGGHQGAQWAVHAGQEGLSLGVRA